ncbi:hypothetical protein vseg_006972 [Gypsophila vaccaria]
MATVPLKKTRGRRKVALELMQKTSNRLVTFSKRRTGLFKKASELCTLCAAEVLVIVCSPGDKIFSFGHPMVDTISDRFLLGNGGLPNLQIPEGGENEEVIQVMNDELTSLNEVLETEHRRGEEIHEERNRMDPATLKFLAPVEQLTPAELREVQRSLLVIREQVYQHGIALFQAQEDTGVYQAHNPNLDPNFVHVPMPVTHDNPLQLSMDPHPMVRLLPGSNDAPSMMMVPTPRGVVEDLPVAMMGPSGFGGQFFPSTSFVQNNSSFVPNIMATSFPPPSMMQPMDQAPNPSTEEQYNNEGQVPPTGGFMGFLMGGEGNSSAPFNPQTGEGSLSVHNPQVGEGSSFVPFNPRVGEGSSFAHFYPRAGQGSWSAPFNPSGEGSSSAPFNPQGGEGSSFSRFNPRAGEGSSSGLFNHQGGEGSSFSRFNPRAGEGSSSGPFYPSGEGSSFSLFNPRAGEGSSFGPFNPSGEGSSFSHFNPRAGEGSSSAPFNPSGEGSSSAPFNPQGGFNFGPGSS